MIEAVADGTRKEYMESVATVPLLIIDDCGMRKLPHSAARLTRTRTRWVRHVKIGRRWDRLARSAVLGRENE
jgi:hypothetical protein